MKKPPDIFLFPKKPHTIYLVIIMKVKDFIYRQAHRDLKFLTFALTTICY
jgi:hypothetical protein